MNDSPGSTTKSPASSAHPFLYVLVTFVAFRLMAVLLLKPGGYVTALSDFTFYRLLARYAAQGFYPSVHYWMEYQPLFPWIPVGIYRLSLLLPDWGAPGFWFNIFMGSFFLLAETANLGLIYFIARRLYRQAVAVRVAWIYSLLFVPLLIMLGWFDVLGLTFLLLALYLTLRHRSLGGGVVAGLGFLVKLLPLIVVPVAFWREPTWRRRALLIAITGLTIVVVALPFALLNPELFGLSWTINLKRGSWETVWALLEGYTSYGLAGGGNRFDPAEAGANQPPSHLPWPLISLGFALLYLWLWTRPTDWNDDRRAVAFTGLTMNLVTLYLKGYSPQFLVWLLPFPILLFPGLRGIAYALLLSAVNLVESPLYFTLLPDQTWLLTGAVLARSGLLILLAVEYGRMALSQPIPAVWSRRLCLGAAALLALLGTSRPMRRVPLTPSILSFSAALTCPRSRPLGGSPIGSRAWSAPSKAMPRPGSMPPPIRRCTPGWRGIFRPSPATSSTAGSFRAGIRNERPGFQPRPSAGPVPLCLPVQYLPLDLQRSLPFQ